MKTLYVAPLAAVQSAGPRGTSQFTTCPGAQQWCLVVVERWADDQAEDDWENMNGVQPLHIENWGQQVPAAAVTAFGPWGVVPTDTIRQAVKKIRGFWSAARI